MCEETGYNIVIALVPIIWFFAEAQSLKLSLYSEPLQSIFHWGRCTTWVSILLSQNLLDLSFFLLRIKIERILITWPLSTKDLYAVKWPSFVDFSQKRSFISVQYQSKNILSFLLDWRQCKTLWLSSVLHKTVFHNRFFLLSSTH